MDAGRGRLAVMMALNYAVQGAWWPLLAVHLQDLGLSGRARGWIFATYAVACLATPLGAGQLADRRMPTQRLLGWIYALGSGLLAVLALGLIRDPTLLFLFFLGYWFITAPGYGLGSTVAFRNLASPATQFAGVRLWGTVGWMAAGWVVTAILWGSVPATSQDGRAGSTAFAVSAALSLLFSWYCFRRLPDTPPLDKGSRATFDLREALDLLRHRDLAAFLAIAFSVGLTMPFVYQTVPTYLGKAGLPRPWIASAMTLSQVPEILALAVLPWLHRRIGLRATLALGIGAWVVEFLVLATQPSLAVALLVIPFNGLAIAGFVISGQMFLDSQAPPHCRARTQSLWVVLVSGVGSLLGSVLAGEVVSRSHDAGIAVFLIPGLINCAALCALLNWFRPGVRPGGISTRRTAPAALATGKLSSQS